MVNSELTIEEQTMKSTNNYVKKKSGREHSVAAVCLRIIDILHSGKIYADPWKLDYIMYICDNRNHYST